MFHPIGQRPPSVYWRRRFILFAGLVVLLLLVVLSVRAVTSNASGAGTQAGGQHPGNGKPPAAATTTPHTSASRDTTRTTTKRTHTAKSHSAKASHTAQSTSPKAPGKSGSPSGSATHTPPPARCTTGQLSIQAVTGSTTYHVGQKPLVELEVTDTGTTPCVQNLADSEVVLKVFNGESRVWGSHDCNIKSGTIDRVLMPGEPVRVQIQWSGYTSTPGCQAQRQRVGAGTYTLYPYLAGQAGKAAQFSIV